MSACVQVCVTKYNFNWCDHFMKKKCMRDIISNKDINAILWLLNVTVPTLKRLT